MTPPPRDGSPPDPPDVATGSTRSAPRAALAIFAILGAETASLRLGVAPAFGRMFDDFGGRDALPGWTQAWVYGFSPYIVALLLGAVLVVGAARASSPRSLATVVALGVALLAVTVGGAMSAFYLPMFLTVP